MERESERRRREEIARMREFERKQREEAIRLEKERERLRIERERLEREKAEILRLEREQQRLEREKIEAEREELKRRQARYILSQNKSALTREEAFHEQRLSEAISHAFVELQGGIMNHFVRQREFNDCFDGSWSNSTIHDAT